MSKRERKAMNVESMESIDILVKQGVGSTTISRILQRSETSVKHYAQIIKMVEEGNPILVNPKSYQMSVVKDFCKKRGYSEPIDGYKPTESTAQISIPEIIPPIVEPQIDPKAVSNMLCDISDALDAAINHIRIMANYFARG